MTQVFCLNDSLYNEDGLYISDDQWLVYWYEDGGYDGSGEAVKLDKNGKLFRKSLTKDGVFTIKIVKEI